MQYGICNLSIVPLRIEPSHKSELISQILYGEHFKILEQRKTWSKIRLAFDTFEGWIDNEQYIEILKDDYKVLQNELPKLSSDIVEFVLDENKELYTIPLGSSLNGLELLNHTHDGNTVYYKNPKEEIIKTAFIYLNAPYLWGGKTASRALLRES